MIDRRSLVIGAGVLAACTEAPESPERWRVLPTRPYPHKQDNIFFVSPDRGWYGNGDGLLYTTRDGGETWSKIWEHPGTFIRALGFLDEQNGFLGNLGMGPSPRITDTQPLYRTRDGGATWTPIVIAGAGAVKGVCAIDILPRRVIFQGAVETRHVIHAAGRAFGPATILRSPDSGETWRVIDLSAQAGMLLDVKFLDTNTGFVCAATSTDLEQSNAAILRTADGGASWRRVYQSRRPLELCWKISWPSRRVGYATVQNDSDEVTQRVIAKTTDGGVTWRELPIMEDAHAREFGVGFVSEQRGWVGTSNGGYETIDGGRTWRPVDLGASVNKIRILYHGDRFTVFAIGLGVSRLDGDLR